MSILLDTIGKYSKIGSKKKEKLEEELKNELSEMLVRSMRHGYQMSKDDPQKALEIAHRTFMTNI